jgi:hypothetical protein
LASWIFRQRALPSCSIHASTASRNAQAMPWRAAAPRAAVWRPSHRASGGVQLQVCRCGASASFPISRAIAIVVATQADDLRRRATSTGAPADAFQNRA